MNDHLLDAILADPTDDGARAVYADALTQAGDPRGEFITLQLAGDEGLRVSQLRKRHQKKWLGELGAVVNKTWIGWRRGFLARATLRLTLPKLKAVASSKHWATVEEIDLIASDPRDTWKAAFVTLLEHLPSLTKITSAKVRVLRWIPPATAARLEELSYVELLSGELAEVLAIAAGMPRLRGLGMSPRARSDEPLNLDALARSPLLARLEWLEIETLGLACRLARGRLVVEAYDHPGLPLLRQLSPVVTTVARGEHLTPSQLKRLGKYLPRARIET
jgi:uncharacterized protein (TIGR02996 family)